VQPEIDSLKPFSRWVGVQPTHSAHLAFTAKVLEFGFLRYRAIGLNLLIAGTSRLFLEVSHVFSYIAFPPSGSTAASQ